MKIHGSETDIRKLILNKTIASVQTAVKIEGDKEDLLIASLDIIKNKGCNNDLGKVLAEIAKEAHPDLMYGSAILASTGMNKNDDVFLSDEMWQARNTAVNIPYNDDHNSIDIIGHIIAARPLNKEGKIIASTAVPSYFDLEVDFVVYKSIFPTIAQDIYENAPKGKKFVSLEAVFDDFAYALVYGSDFKIVNRNDETSFLTKYLRAYGGEGYYKNRKIGRVIKDFRFIGMGNVTEPANMNSEYTKFENYEIIANIGDETNSKVVLYVTKGKTMKIETLDQANELIASLTEEIETLKAAEGQKEVVGLKNQVEALTSEKVSLSDQLSAESTKVTVAEQQRDESKNQTDQLNEKIKTLEAELLTKTEELNKFTMQAKVNERISKLKELKIEVPVDKQDKIASMSDEAFASVIDFTSQYNIKKEEENINQSDENSKEAEKKLENVEENTTANVEETAGDQITDLEKNQKVAAKLIEGIRKYRKDNKKKIDKKE